MPAKKQESIEIYVAYCAFYLEYRGSMQSQLYVDAPFARS